MDENHRARCVPTWTKARKLNKTTYLWTGVRLFRWIHDHSVCFCGASCTRGVSSKHVDKSWRSWSYPGNNKINGYWITHRLVVHSCFTQAFVLNDYRCQPKCLPGLITSLNRAGHLSYWPTVWSTGINAMEDVKEMKVKKSNTYRDQTTSPPARATIMPSNLRAHSCYELVGFGGKPVRFQSGWYEFKPASNQLPADLCLQVLSMSWSANQIGKWIPERLNQVVVQLPDAWNLILPLVSTSTRATDCFRFMLKVKRSRGRHSAGRTATTVPFAPFFTMPWITQMPSTKTLVNQRYPKQPATHRDTLQIGRNV